ncbi:cytochrome c oxidase accessory protein CcoG [Brumimicrobium oceani]|uniref:Cytochrome c oxidase accessory protein CcoG n=1 Tax=Brumimicrobium oceani TaxID=2100725 RepID=A0A2U2XF29_9FLAO|nr:cytochrome c oxidase accessory protein CcoG [Brumimicrobium oceani]PWH86340.1 cytochrome c oxidase accessory protein CcoG [Brumimicrobium oceani]
MLKEEDLYEDEFRDSISTIGEDGKRIWVYPKKPKGMFHKWRLVLSIFLIAFLFVAPHIKIGGQPLILIGILERKFVLFGQVFWPQDLYIFAFTMILMMVFIILFTVVFGRVFCGWVCPQTIFMEFVFRKIEYWIEGDWTRQKKLNKQPWNKEKIFKKTAKHSIFLLVSFLIGNTFLAYIIGADALWEIQTDPLSAHLGGFIAMVVFSLVFYGVFAFMREQVCTTICPYGRLQGVLLDKDSIIVAYDHKRGESRGRFKKTENREEVGKGDCIDCKQCVHVCPTGIDIRNGTQLECVNCTACIDACDDIMEAVNLPKGLIRYASENNIEGGKKFKFTKRMQAYTALLGLLLVIWGALVFTRTDFEAVVLKKRGSTYQVLENGIISNIYEISLINKSKESFDVQLQLEDGLEGSISMPKSSISLGPEEQIKDNFVIRLDSKELKRGQKKLKIKILGDGEELYEVKTSFVGPLL